MDNAAKIRLMEVMLQIRTLESEFGVMFKTGKLPLGAHLYEGQEAVAAGVCANLRQDDYITSTHRGHGHCVAKGLDLKSLMAEVCGKKTGCCHGKGGTMHMFDPSIGLMGTIGIVGGGIPIATGLALSEKIKKGDKVAVSFFGDGASNNGAFHESLNLAGLWQLPAIYVCENNQYATSVAVHRSTPIKDIGNRASAYNVTGVVVDGNKVDEVYEAAKEAVTRARSGGGPTLLECKTYRIRGHYEGDDTWDYRTREEVAAARERDPIEYWKNILISEGVLDEATFNELKSKAEAEVAEAEEFALSSPFPEPEDALTLAGSR